METVLDPTLLGWPLAAALVVLASHVALGREVLARGIVFLDLAVAQVAALGLLAAQLLGWEPAGWRMQVSALAAALLAAALVHVMEKRWAGIQEPLIGALFVIAASLASVLATLDPHGGEHLRDLLAGQILWVSPAQIGLAGGISLLALALWLVGRAHRAAFYLAFALCITQSVQLVGVYMVFACLIFPALAVRGLATPAALLRGYGAGMLGALAGLVLSMVFDLPTGPIIVLTLGLAALLLGMRTGRHHAPQPTSMK